MFAPAQTPAAVIDRPCAETEKIVRQPEVKELAPGVASEIVGNSPRAANATVRDATAMWAKVV